MTDVNITKGTIMAKENMSNAEQFLWFGAARTRFHLSYLALWLDDNAPLILLSRLGRFLFLVAAGFLSVALIACAGGGGGSSSGDGGPVNNGSIINVSMDDEPGTDPGNVDPGSGSPSDNDNDGIENADDNCPDVANPRQTDTDGDSEGDACDEDDDNDNVMDGTDIDDDGDGLIEIANATELDAVRHQLDGTGRKLSASGMLDQTGCGRNAGDACSGYELVADISLAAYADADNGKGWQPLGHDTDNASLGCQGDSFDGTFEGNGWTISDLNINRLGQDCVGLFGRVGANSEIRNLTLRAERVIGKQFVGGLVGVGESIQVHSSSVEVVEVRGGQRIGGLVGAGSGTEVYSSSVVVSEVRGAGDFVGGLVGSGSSARIHSSSVVAVKVRGVTQNTGGLVGIADSAHIFSSSVVAAEVSGSGNNVGGLIGVGDSAQIYSSSVVVSNLSGPNNVGGLAGFFNSGRIAYSYVVSGSQTNMLAGSGSGTGNASYWDSMTSGVTSGNYGEAQTSEQLQMPTGYQGIYANWTNDMGIFGDEDEPLAVWCDQDNSGNITADEQEDENRIWDFGTNTEYPAIECTPIDPDEWRSWWSLNANGKPELDGTNNWL